MTSLALTHRTIHVQSTSDRRERGGALFDLIVTVGAECSRCKTYVVVVSLRAVTVGGDVLGAETVSTIFGAWRRTGPFCGWVKGGGDWDVHLFHLLHLHLLLTALENFNHLLIILLGSRDLLLLRRGLLLSGRLKPARYMNSPSLCSHIYPSSAS